MPLRPTGYTFGACSLDPARRASRRCPCRRRRTSGTPWASARRIRLRPATGRRAARSAYELALALLDQVVVGLGPHVVALVHEELEPQTRAPVLDQIRRPPPEVLDPSDLDRRVVDVDPVVGKAVRLGDDERDGDEVAVAQRVGRRQDRRADGRVHRAQERADRHRRDHLGARVPARGAVGRSR